MYNYSRLSWKNHYSPPILQKRTHATNTYYMQMKKRKKKKKNWLQAKMPGGLFMTLTFCEAPCIYLLISCMVV